MLFQGKIDMHSPSQTLEQELVSNLQSMLTDQFHVSKDTHVGVIYDDKSPLAQLITMGYRDALKSHPQEKQTFLDFNAHTHEELVAKITENFSPGDFVALVQSHSFRVSVYRWRLELFARKLKVAEHMRLSYMPAEQFSTYVRCIKNDSPYFVRATQKLASLFRQSTHIKVECMQGSILDIHSAMEEPISNTGEFSEKETNVGGGIPFGEIFSEPKDISKWEGEVEVFAFPGEDHKMVFTKPFKLKIKQGHVAVEESDIPSAFIPLIQMMQKENPDGKIPIREFGLGLNHAISRENPLTEATAWERGAGLHFSLGMKHGVYQKKFAKQKEINQRYHIDIYPDVKRIWIAEELVYDNGTFLV